MVYTGNTVKGIYIVIVGKEPNTKLLHSGNFLLHADICVEADNATELKVGYKIASQNNK